METCTVAEQSVDGYIKQEVLEHRGEVTSLDTLNDFLNIYSNDPQEEVVFDPECVAMDRVEKEMAYFKALDARDSALGMETNHTRKKFSPLKFFANPSIASRFPPSRPTCQVVLWITSS